MATTTNFNWSTPNDTDLVKDGAAAIRTLGNSIDTSFVDLKGGTTGQVLSKASGTDLDFTWVAQDDSNAIQNAIVDAKGDLIAASAADTPARLAVGTNGQVLVADSTASTGLAWTTLASGSGMTLITSGTFSASSEFNLGTCFNSTYRNYKIILDTTATSTNLQLRAKLNDDSNHSGRIVTVTNATSVTQLDGDRWAVAQFDGSIGSIDMTIFAPQVAEYTKFVCLGTASSVNSWSGGVKTANTGFTTITFFTSTGNITGNYRVYGLANS